MAKKLKAASAAAALPTPFMPKGDAIRETIDGSREFKWLADMDPFQKAHKENEKARAAEKKAEIRAAKARQKAAEDMKLQEERGQQKEAANAQKQFARMAGGQKGSQDAASRYEGRDDGDEKPWERTEEFVEEPFSSPQREEPAPRLPEEPDAVRQAREHADSVRQPEGPEQQTQLE